MMKDKFVLKEKLTQPFKEEMDFTEFIELRDFKEFLRRLKEGLFAKGKIDWENDDLFYAEQLINELSGLGGEDD